MMSKSFSLAFGYLWSGIWLFSCSAEPGNQAGSCRLECSKAVIGGPELVIESMMPKDLKYGCSAKTSGSIPFGGPITIRYRAYYKAGTGFGKDSTTPAASSTAGGSSGSTGNVLQPGDVPGGYVAAQSVSFKPWVFGVMDSSQTNPEFLSADKQTVTPFEYNGVTTPSANFCSDTCGVMEYSIWPVCIVPVENTVRASLVAGSAKPVEEVKIPITGEKDKEE